MKKSLITFLLLCIAVFTGCQVSYVKPTRGESASNITVYQGFSRSAVGAQNTLDAATTKTSSMLTAQVNPELNSEINPALSSEVNPALASEINPELSGNSAEVNPEIDANIEAEVSDIYKGGEIKEEEAEPEPEAEVEPEAEAEVEAEVEDE